MAVEALDKVTVAAEMPKKEYSVERPRVPLVLKLFGLTALLIAIVVAVAMAITITRANAVAGTTVETSITSAAKLFDEFEAQRFGRLAGHELAPAEHELGEIRHREAHADAGPQPRADGREELATREPISVEEGRHTRRSWW